MCTFGHCTGFIGVGMRGKDAAICDLEQKHIDKVQNRLISRGCAKAVEYIGEDSWKELCERDDIERKSQDYPEELLMVYPAIHPMSI